MKRFIEQVNVLIKHFVSVSSQGTCHMEFPRSNKRQEVQKNVRNAKQRPHNKLAVILLQLVIKTVLWSY